MGTIPDNSKFAALSLHGTGARITIGDPFCPSLGLLATTALPFEVTPWWLDQLGQLTAEEIKGSDIYLLAHSPSVNLDVLDGENSRLEENCRNFFYGLLIAVPIYADKPPQLVTGSMKSGSATFRQIGRFERPAYILGTPPGDVSSEDLQKAVRFGLQIEALAVRQGAFGRAIWAVNCFMDGLTATHVYEKLRAFVRTIEAFLLPDTGKTEKQFKSRTELFLGPKEHDLMGTIYSLRSNIEHLHDPLALLPGSTPKDKLIALCRNAFVAEAIARYCLQRFLTKPELHPHFETDASISSFWTLAPSERSQLWGDPLDVKATAPLFDPFLANAQIQ